MDNKKRRCEMHGRSDSRHRKPVPQNETRITAGWKPEEPQNSGIENIAPLETVVLGFSQTRTKLFLWLAEEGTPTRIKKTNPEPGWVFWGRGGVGYRADGFAIFFYKKIVRKSAIDSFLFGGHKVAIVNGFDFAIKLRLSRSNLSTVIPLTTLIF